MPRHDLWDQHRLDIRRVHKSRMHDPAHHRITQTQRLKPRRRIHVDLRLIHLGPLLAVSRPRVILFHAVALLTFAAAATIIPPVPSATTISPASAASTATAPFPASTATPAARTRVRPTPLPAAAVASCIVPAAPLCPAAAGDSFRPAHRPARCFAGRPFRPAPRRTCFTSNAAWLTHIVSTTTFASPTPASTLLGRALAAALRRSAASLAT